VIRILMLDLGGTLIRETDLAPFPGVEKALAALALFVDAQGAPLERCLVSNYPAQLPVPAERLPATFQEFLALLPPAIRTSFEPVERRITLSAHAGVAKPRPEVFAKAIERLGVSAGLPECLFVTEQKAHVDRCRELGMAALWFGGNTTPPAPGSDFADWAEAPLLIARQVGAAGTANLVPALRAHLGVARPDMEKVVVRGPLEGRRVSVEAQSWVRLDDPKLGPLAGVHVQLPVVARVHLDAQGGIERVEGGAPDPHDVQAACQMVESLVSSGQVTGTGPAGPGPTHVVETDAQGRRLLRRRRFGAL